MQRETIIHTFIKVTTKFFCRNRMFIFQGYFCDDVKFQIIQSLFLISITWTFSEAKICHSQKYWFAQRSVYGSYKARNDRHIIEFRRCSTQHKHCYWKKWIMTDQGSFLEERRLPEVYTFLTLPTLTLKKRPF